ncbi:contactin-3 [Triplophysa dalaica]|uniref:contactin-3 n=1 Tax=Triplophysa dalaica TaxID=1582913 RepID=UPI0024DFEA21|nr:contactin-3 [Triplophysa dalaica]
MTLLWKQFLLLSIMEYLAECLDYKSFNGPKWRMEPSDLTVGSLEEEATLTCDAKGIPPPQYRWSLNSTLINLRTDSRRRLSGGNLVIRSLDRAQDGGIYQCTAFNPLGAVLSRRASLQFAYLNLKTQTRSAVSVREGQGVVLLCGTPSYAGDLSFAWVFNEYPYFVQQDNRRFVSQETGNLYIAKVEPSDVGNYTCVVVNRITKSKVLSSPTPLVLRTDGVMGEYEPKIEVHFSEMVPAAKGSIVTLECFALGNPVPQITWRRANGVPFPSKVKMKNSNVVLEIPSFQQEDAGGYECVAENKMGKNTVQGRLSFHAKPQWVQTMRDSALSIEERLFWECKANGKPKPSYSWLKNGEPLVVEDRIHIDNGALAISSVNLSDGGIYQCVAENKHGIIYFGAELVVLALPPDFSRSPLRALLKAKTGSTVSMECKPQAFPTAISLWRKDNDPLHSTERIALLPDGTLRITNVTKMDRGTYSCMAKNQFGAASTTGRLLVTDPTQITQGPVDMEIIVGESIVLPCQISCDPALDVSFSWAFNGQLLSKLDQHYEHVGGGTSGDLMIRNIQLKHAGKYVCVVDTDVESLSAAAILIVKGPPGAPDGVTVEEITDSTAQLSWRPSQDNGSPITSYIIQAKTAFTVGWQAVNTVPEVIDGNTRTATVVDLNAWVEFEFRVLARNSVGVGEPSPASLKTRTEDAVPDTAPADVGGGGGSKSELVITWEPVPEELQNGDGFGYIIAFRPLGEVNWTHAVISAPAQSRYLYRNESISPFSPFNVKVGAYNTKGQGPFSPVTIVFSAENEPSGVPAGVWARSISATEIEVMWHILTSSPERVLGYEVVYWEDDTKPETMGKVRVSANQNKVNISGLRGYTQYFLTLSAFNTAGTGPISPTINVTTKKSPPGQSPLNVEWNLIGSKLTVHWEAVISLEMESEVTGYQVSYRRNRHKEINTISTNLTSVELTLPADDDYIIQIKALSDGGEGTPTEPINIHKLSMSVRGSRAWRANTIPISLLSIIALSTVRPALC